VIKLNLSDLQNKEVIDISTGTRLGSIIDVIISLDGTIQKLILDNRKLSRKILSKNDQDITIEWKQIIKIGDDILLVKSNNYDKRII
jgi:YlmC/YmxH family sporulation protein